MLPLSEGDLDMRTGSRRVLTCVAHVISTLLFLGPVPNQDTVGPSCVAAEIKSSAQCCCRTFNMQCCGGCCCGKNSPAPERQNLVATLQQRAADQIGPWATPADSCCVDGRSLVLSTSGTTALNAQRSTLLQQGVRLNV